MPGSSSRRSPRAGIARAGRPGAGKAARAVVIGTVPRLAAVALASAAIPAAVAAFDPTPVVTAREAFFFLSAACLAPPVLAAIYFGLRAPIASLAIAVLVGALALSTPLAHGNYSRNAGEIGSADAFTASVAGVGFYTLVALVGLGVLLAARYAVERTLRRTSR